MQRSKVIWEIKQYKQDRTFEMSEEVVEFIINSLETDEAYQLEYEDWKAYRKKKMEEQAIDKSDEFEEWKLNEDKDCYLRIGDIVDRFKEIDEHYNHSPWTLTQIFSNLNILQRVECKMELSTTKNDLPHCQHTDEEIAKSFIEDVEAVKDLLPTTKNDLGVDCVSRADVDAVIEQMRVKLKDGRMYILAEVVQDMIRELPSVTPQEPRWIPVSERLPEELEPVNITWVNHNPESYYTDIKDKPFTATGVYFNGQWYWWSTLCTDILAEYSHNYDDIIDNDVEIIAWMPLPKPYKAESEPQESEVE